MVKTASKKERRAKIRAKKTAGHDAAFVEHYLGNVPRNALQAYKKLHPNVSDKTAGVEGCKLLKKPSVSAMVEARTKELQNKLELNTENVLKQLGRQVFFDIRKLYKDDGKLKAPHELDDETALAIASVETEELFEGRGEDREHIGTTRKVKIFDKNPAVANAMKHLGLFKEDNKQRTDPVRELLAAIDGRSKIKPRSAA